MSQSSVSILRVFRGASAAHVAEGMAWYATAHAAAADMAAAHDVTLEAAAGVIAALSPKTSWTRNLTLAAAVLAGDDKPAGVMGDPLRKALAIRDGADPDAVLGGPKVRAFYAGIIANGATDVVCVDRHAIDVVLGRKHSDATRPNLTPRRYNEMADAYRRAARILSREIGEPITAAQVQAITWVAWRSEHAWERVA